MEAVLELIHRWGTFDTLCTIAGMLFLVDLLAYLPFFYVGFAKTENEKYVPERSWYLVTLGFSWMISCVLLSFGGVWSRLLGTATLYAIFRHYYIQRRWNSVRRGFGAPGFMSHWTMLYLLLIQIGLILDPSQFLGQRFLLMSRIDFAVIMICAGTYKYLIGYLHSDGMEYGRVNPFWGYRWSYYKKQSPSGLYVKFTNICASGFEILAGFLMLMPKFQLLGAAMITGSFLFVACYIRLGRLAILMATLPIIYCPNFLHSTSIEAMQQSSSAMHGPQWLIGLLSAAITVFIVVLPMVKINQYLNLFANKTLPEPLQTWLTRYSNWVPIIIWRVFTPDVTNFFVRIYHTDEQGQEHTVLNEARYALSDLSNPGLKLRFLHVTESIALTSVFTTLKYFPSNRQLFNDKLLTYAQSISHDIDSKPKVFRFEYVAISKGPSEFVFTAVGNFWVDLSTSEVWEKKIVEEFDYSAPSKFSPVRESVAPGSYVKAG